MKTNTANKKKLHAARLINKLVEPHLENLTVDMFSTEECIGVLSEILNSRTGKLLRSKPTNCSDNASLLFDFIRFHRSRGSLWGYPWFPGKDADKERCENLALVLLQGQSRAADAWKGVIHGR